MSRCRKLWALNAALAACCLPSVSLAQPDVIVGELPDLTQNAVQTVGSVTYDAFAVGTTSCNKGSVPLNWWTASNSDVSYENRHPTIGQNLFRLQNGRFEQIGQAWLKHGFTALQGNACGLGCTASPSGSSLGVGCSDPYSSGLNNSQSALGPKWQVNAATGLFPYPFAAGSGSGTTYKRLRVRTSDLGGAGARYFVEGQYICGDDAAAGNKNNNASYREVTFSGTGDFTMNLSGSTQREQPAINAWATIDPSVTLTTLDIPNDGRFILACKVTDNGNGTYTYDYALHNLNSDRCAGGFIVPLPGTQPAVTGIEFKDVEYHSGEPNQIADPATPDSDNWTVAGGGANANSISWNGPAYAGTPATVTMDTVQYRVLSWTAGTGNDHSANVLRWGTMFNFRFTTTVAPANGNVQINLWRPGTPTTALMTVRTPGGATAGVLTGACCNGTSCSVTAQGSCTGGGGTFVGAGSTCSPNPCATGSCCTAAGGCTVTTAANCSATWTNGAICVPNPCPQPTGVCCNGTSCTFVTQANCSGSWTTGGSCSPNPCQTGSCCTAAGACSITTQANCSATWTSGASSCTPNPCPQPTGRCCIGTGCTITTQSACTGSWTTGGSCTPNPCGSNDLCTSASPLCDDVTVSGTTVGATTEGSTTCGTPNSNDRWYSYTPATNATLSFATLSGGTLTDTVLAVFSACGGTQLACDDDGGPGNLSLINGVSGVAGTTYLIRVARWGSTTDGTFNIRVTGGGGQGCTGNGRCCIGTGCTITTQAGCSGSWAAGACSPNPCDPTGSCCNGTSCSSTTQSACSAGTFTAGGSCSPNPCDPLGSCCIQGNCNSTTASGCSAGGSAWTSGRSCTPNPCPPQTDNCSERAGVGLGATPFDTTNATTDGPTHTLCTGSGDSNVAKDIWFNFPSLFDGTLTIDTCGSSFDTRIAVYSGYGCENYEARLVACNDDSAACAGGTVQSQVQIPVTCGSYYTIRIGGWTNAQGVVAAGPGTMTLTATENATGSCCAADGGCTVTHQSCCQATWTSGAGCEPNNCPQPTGACCNPNTGGCSIATHSACGAAQSLYQGDGTSCTPNPCVQPMGACCQADGSCLETAFGACSGNYMGNNTSCSPNPCPQPTGSCCIADGSCSVTTQAACSGAWTGGGGCSPNPCPQPIGSCCDAASGSCSLVTQANCSGAWTSGGSCTPNPCPQPNGACCCGSSCRIVSQAACSGTGQVFVGGGSVCSPYSATVPCCRGDYNKVTGTSVQDIFDFLAGYFAQDPCSDSNDSNTSSVQDIFDFLAAYFGGC